jgi:aryl-alcohol dehydrogenase-like predicted oxidoreductase
MTQRPEPYADFETDRVFGALERLERYARDRGMTMAGVALAWLFADDRVAQVVIGPGRPEHLDPVREALANPLTASEQALVTEMFL